jgi:hypothetical protein
LTAQSNQNLDDVATQEVTVKNAGLLERLHCIVSEVTAAECPAENGVDHDGCQSELERYENDYETITNRKEKTDIMLIETGRVPESSKGSTLCDDRKVRLIAFLCMFNCLGIRT